MSYFILKKIFFGFIVLAISNKADLKRKFVMRIKNGNPVIIEK